MVIVVAFRSMFWEFWKSNILSQKQQGALRNVRLFNPRQQRWTRHFAWTDEGAHISGLTASGRATVLALQLNNPYAVAVRQAWISAGWHPPTEDIKADERSKDE